MAGMLPGVEAARIRRFHHSSLNNGGGSSTRRSSFCLYATNYQEFRITSHSSVERNPMRWAGCDDEKLEAAAREAKKRLDHRLQTHWKSSAIKRKLKGQERSTSVEESLKSQGHSQNKCTDQSGKAETKAAKLASGNNYISSIPRSLKENNLDSRL